MITPSRKLEKAVALDSKNSLYHQWLGRAYGGKGGQRSELFSREKE